MAANVEDIIKIRYSCKFASLNRDAYTESLVISTRHAITTPECNSGCKKCNQTNYGQFHLKLFISITQTALFMFIRIFSSEQY